MIETVDHTGKVPLTVYLPATKEGEEWQPVFQRVDADDKVVVVFRLRPIVSATVTLEGIPRRDAELIVKYWANESADDINSRLAASARAALARQLCPVMVCRTAYGGGFIKCRWDKERSSISVGEHLDRRPCKLSEGHGGEHE